MWQRERSIGYVAIGDINSFPRTILDRIRRDGLKAVEGIGFPIVEFPGFLGTPQEANPDFSYPDDQRQLESRPDDN